MKEFYNYYTTQKGVPKLTKKQLEEVIRVYIYNLIFYLITTGLEYKIPSNLGRFVIRMKKFKLKQIGDKHEDAYLLARRYNNGAYPIFIWYSMQALLVTKRLWKFNIARHVKRSSSYKKGAYTHALKTTIKDFYIENYDSHPYTLMKKHT